MITTVEAVIDEQGNVTLLERVRPVGARRALVTILEETSKPYGDARAVQLAQSAFASGSLRVTSYVRPGKRFTASGDLITGEVGVLTPEAPTGVVDAVVNLLRGNARQQP